MGIAGFHHSTPPRHAHRYSTIGIVLFSRKHKDKLSLFWHWSCCERKREQATQGMGNTGNTRMVVMVVPRPPKRETVVWEVEVMICQH